jgi:hypothetical protein
MMPRSLFLLTVASLFLTDCAGVTALRTWSPRRAASDAERDIALNDIKFAYVGGWVPHAPALPERASAVAQAYPQLPVGPQGCIQDSAFDVRAEYARRYNRRMWKHVSHMRANRPTR